MKRLLDSMDLFEIFEISYKDLKEALEEFIRINNSFISIAWYIGIILGKRLHKRLRNEGLSNRTIMRFLYRKGIKVKIIGNYAYINIKIRSPLEDAILRGILTGLLSKVYGKTILVKLVDYNYDSL